MSNFGGLVWQANFGQFFGNLTWIATLKTKYSLLHVNITVFELYFLFKFPDKGHVFTNSFPPKLRSHPPRGG